MKAVMYGAGNIGRGFIGQLFYNSGYDVAFVDVNADVLNALNTAREYPVRTLFHEGYEEQMIKNVSGVDGNNIEAVAAAIAGADVMATAVGVNVLKFIIKPIAAGIEKRYSTNKKPLNIIICENLLGADSYLRKLLNEALSNDEVRSWFNENIGLVEASIGRMVPLQTPEMQGDNPLRVCVESYGILPTDKLAFKGTIPDIKNMTPFSPFEFFIERKLFIHNMGHALTAYLGNLFENEYIYESIGNPEIELLVLRAMNESAVALSKKHGVPYPDVYEHVEDLLFRFGNRQLGDTVERVGRDLRRKLSSNDRMIGALNTCIETGTPYKYIALGIAAALCFTFDALPSELSREQILTEVSGLDISSDAAQLIIKLNDMLKSSADLSEIAAYLKTI